MIPLTNELIAQWLSESPENDPEVYVAWKAYQLGFANGCEHDREIEFKIAVRKC